MSLAGGSRTIAVSPVFVAGVRGVLAGGHWSYASVYLCVARHAGFVAGPGGFLAASAGSLADTAGFVARVPGIIAETYLVVAVTPGFVASLPGFYAGTYLAYASARRLFQGTILQRFTAAQPRPLRPARARPPSQPHEPTQRGRPVYDLHCEETAKTPGWIAPSLAR